MGTARRPGHFLVTAFEHAKLFHLVHETILTYCGNRGRVAAVELFQLYDRYLRWLAELTESVRTVKEDDNPLPHVIFLQCVPCR